MRRAVLLLVLLVVPGTLFAQSRDDRDESWRDREARDRYGRFVRHDNYFEIVPFLGYRYGGTLFADRTDLFNRDLELESRPNFGVNFGIPIGDDGFKVELMVDHQATHLTTGNGLFDPGNEVADLDVTYYHAGALIPFAVSRSVTPFVSLSAGVANLDLGGVGGTSSDNRFSAGAGIGAKFPINRNVAFRIEARGFFTSLGDDNNNCSRCGFNENHDLYQGETNFGVSFSF